MVGNVQYIIKRDGVTEVFCESKLYDAIYSASKACDQACDVEALTHKVISRLKGEVVSVEDVQDTVVHCLMTSKYKLVASEYIKHRSERSLKREMKGDLYKDLQGLLDQTDDEHARANANKAPEQIVSHRDLIAGVVSKQYAKIILPDRVKEAHQKGLVWSHDGDYLISKGIHNCGVYDFEYMLANGVKLGDVEIESPKSVGTAANVICQILSKISGSSYGGQSLHEFDQVLKPYVEKSLDKLRNKQKLYSLPEDYIQEVLRKEVYDACQLVIYQVQTVSSPNGQSSFYSMSLSLSTDPICKMIKEEYLKCHTEGIGPKKQTPIFPKVIYFVEKGVNMDKGDPNYEEYQLALKCTSKRMYPDYVMAPNNRVMTGSEKMTTPMGRR